MLDYTLWALVIIGTYAVGHHHGRQTTRPRTFAGAVRDQINGFRAMGWSKEDSLRLTRELGAHGMRQSGVWDAK